MSIKVICENGHELLAPQKAAGQRLKCPKCASVVEVPLEIVEEVIELDEDSIVDESTAPADPFSGLGPAAMPNDSEDVANATANPFAALPEFPSAPVVANQPTPQSTPTSPESPVTSAPSDQQSVPVPASAEAKAPSASTRSSVSAATTADTLSDGIVILGGIVSATLVVGLVVLALLLLSGGQEPESPTDRLAQNKPATSESQVASSSVATAGSPDSDPKQPPSQLRSDRSPSPSQTPPPETQPSSELRQATPKSSVASSLEKQNDNPELIIHSIPIQFVADIDRRTGRVAIIDPDGRLKLCQPEFFEGDSSAIEPIDVPSDAVRDAVFKPYGDKTLLLVNDVENIWIFDAATSELFDDSGRLKNPVPGPVGAALATSQRPDDPWVYTGNSQFKLGPHPHHFPSAATDGEWIKNVSDSGRYVLSQYPKLNYPRNVAADARWRRGEPRMRIPNVALDPADQVFGASHALDIFSAFEAPERLYKHRYSVVCFLPDTPWMIAVERTELVLAHRNKSETKPLLELPDSFFKLNGSRVEGFVDTKHQRLILGCNSKLASVSLASLSIPKEPLLASRVDLPLVIEPNRKTEAKVHAPQGVDVALVNPPSGVTLVDGVLSWTPTFADVGRRTLTFRNTSGATSADQVIPVVVSDLGVELPFLAGTSYLSPDGSLVLAVSSYAEGDTFTFSLVDPNTKRVKPLGKRLPGQVAAACLDRKEIYIFTGNNQLFVFDLKTFTLKKQFSPISIKFTELSLTSEQLIAKHGSEILRFNRSDLQQTNLPAKGIDLTNSPRRVLNNRLTKIGAGVFGGEPLKCEYFENVPEVVSLRGLVHHDLSQRDPNPPTDLSLLSPETRLVIRNNKRVFSINGQDALVAPTGDVSRIKPKVANGTVSLVIGNALHVLRPMETGLVSVDQDEKEWMSIRPKSAPFKLTARKTRVEYETLGESPTLFEAKLRDHRGSDQFIQTDAESRSVVIDRNALIQSLLSDQSKLSQLLESVLKLPGVYGKSLPEAVNVYRELAEDSLRQYSPIKLEEFPICLTIEVNASNQSKQKYASLAHQMIVELPTRQMLAKLQSSTWLSDRLKSKPSTTKSPSSRPGVKSVSKVEFVEASGNPRADFFARLRKQVIGGKYDLLPIEHAASLSSIPRRITRDQYVPSLCKETTWRLTNGTVIDGTLDQVARDKIRFNLNGEKRKEFPIEQLTFDSLQNVLATRISRDRLNLDLERSSLSRRFDELKDAMLRFSDKNGILPPVSIDDENGVPLLSWRVLLLPELGYEDLFSLFRLDEPWDSEHNKKLVPYMPVEYHIHRDTGVPGRTTVELLSGKGTLFPTDDVVPTSVVRGRDCDQLRIGVLVKLEFAREWTKPTAFSVDSGELPFDQVLRKLRPEIPFSKAAKSVITYSGMTVYPGPAPGEARDSENQKYRPPSAHRFQIPPPR